MVLLLNCWAILLLLNARSVRMRVLRCKSDRRSGICLSFLMCLWWYLSHKGSEHAAHCKRSLLLYGSTGLHTAVGSRLCQCLFLRRTVSAFGGGCLHALYFANRSWCGAAFVTSFPQRAITQVAALK
jgi:hypothetical protein